MVISRFGTIAESKGDVTLEDVLASPAVPSADVILFDSGSSLMPDNLDDNRPFSINATNAQGRFRRTFVHALLGPGRNGRQTASHIACIGRGCS